MQPSESAEHPVAQRAFADGSVSLSRSSTDGDGSPSGRAKTFIAQAVTRYLNSLLPEQQQVPAIPWEADRDHLQVGFQTDDMKTGTRAYRGIQLGFVQRSERTEDNVSQEDRSRPMQKAGAQIWLQVTPDYLEHRFRRSNAGERANHVEHQSMDPEDRFKNRSTQRVEMAAIEHYLDPRQGQDDWLETKLSMAIVSAFFDAFNLESSPVSDGNPALDAAQLRVNGQFLLPEHTVAAPKYIEFVGQMFKVSERFGQTLEETQTHFAGQAAIEAVQELTEPTAEEKRASEKAQKEWLEKERMRLVLLNNRQD